MGHRAALSNKLLRPHGISYLFIQLEDPKEFFNEIFKDSWSATFRFADNCVILLNSDRAKDQAIKAIENFLETRSLKLNKEKTKFRDLRSEPFDFVGYRYRYKIEFRHGKSSMSVFPHDEKVKGLKQKVE